jgi:hypothetical protein
MRHRYRLDRQLSGDGPVVAFFGVNPSRADAERDDPTTKKWLHFAGKLNARAYIAGNPFALRSHDVKQLAQADDPVGPENEWYLQQIMDEAEIYIPCWGAREKLPKPLRPRLDRFCNMMLANARCYGKRVMTFGRTKSGDPKHPLMLSHNTELMEWV